MGRGNKTTKKQKILGKKLKNWSTEKILAENN